VIIENNYHVMEAIEWDDTVNTDVYVINRKDGDVRHLEAQPFYALHHANAYQVNQVNNHHQKDVN
jgi:carotenoid cleavage dioxygenase-like enzyme